MYNNMRVVWRITQIPVTARYKSRTAFDRAEARVTSLYLTICLCTFSIIAYKYKNKIK